MNPPILVIMGVIVVIVAVVLLAIAQQKRERARERALAAWGREHGLVWSPGRRGDLDERYPVFDCLRRGSNRYGYNFIEGNLDGFPTQALDYHYETHSTDSKGRQTTTHHQFSAVILRAPIILDHLFIRPEHFLDRVGEFFGLDDIDFESEEFSRAFHVKAPDRKWAYDVLHQRAMAFLLAQPRHSLAFGDDHVIIWRDTRFSPEEMATAARIGSGLLSMLPDYLEEDRRRYQEPAG